MKLLLLAAGMLALGGCVAPGYDYVQPDYSGAGYYGGGYEGTYQGGGYYPDSYGGCCSSVGMSIGYGYGGYGYGYPGYYGGVAYPYGYYGYPYGYYGHHGDHHDHDDHHDHHDHDGHHHHDDGDWDGHHDGSDHWHGGGSDADADNAVQPWRQADHPMMPRHAEPEASRWAAPVPPVMSPSVQPQIAPRFEPHPRSGSSGHVAAPVRSAPPPRPGTPPKKL